MTSNATVVPSNADLRRLKLLTARQVADLFNVNLCTIWRWTQRMTDALPAIRFGKRCTRFKLADVEKFLERSLPKSA